MEPIKIYAFGDSILKGVEMTGGKLRMVPNRFTDLIGADLSIEVRNTGRLAGTVDGWEKRMELYRDIVASEQAVHVAFAYGSDDCDFRWDIISEDPEAEGVAVTTPDAFVENYRRMVRRNLEEGFRVYLMSIPPVDLQRYVASVMVNRNRENIFRWLRENYVMLLHRRELFNNMIFRVSKEENVPMVDVTTAFLEKGDFRGYLSEDGSHPNEKGHELIAEAIIRYGMEQRNRKERK